MVGDFGCDFYLLGCFVCTPPKFKKRWLEDDPFLLGPGHFSGVNSLLNFGWVLFFGLFFGGGWELELNFFFEKLIFCWRCCPGCFCFK